MGVRSELLKEGEEEEETIYENQAVATLYAGRCRGNEVTSDPPLSHYMTALEVLSSVDPVMV